MSVPQAKGLAGTMAARWLPLPSARKPESLSSETSISPVNAKQKLTLHGEWLARALESAPNLSANCPTNLGEASVPSYQNNKSRM